MRHNINAASKYADDAPLFAGWPEFLYKTQPLVFTWDDQTGEVSGPSADVVRGLAKAQVRYGPPPGSYWTFTANALKSRAEMAVLIASSWELPQEFWADLQALPVPSVTYPQMH